MAPFHAFPKLLFRFYVHFPGVHGFLVRTPICRSVPILRGSEGVGAEGVGPARRALYLLRKVLTKQNRRQNRKHSRWNWPKLSTHVNHFLCDAVWPRHAFLASVLVTQRLPSCAHFAILSPSVSMSSAIPASIVFCPKLFSTQPLS